MPLKPIFEKAPLMTLAELPLRPGQVRVSNDKINQLYALTAAAKGQPAVWEGAFRLACVLKTKPMEEPVAAWINAALAQQGEDGGLPMDMADSVNVMRAALAMYELDAKRPLLEKLAAWCGWLAEHWDDVLACDAVRIHPADLMELLQTLYRVTGKKAILSLCDKLRQQAMDWSGILHTFAVQRPMNRVTAWNDMEAGMEAESGSEAGFYTRQYLTCHGESLADGVRAAMLNGQFSGNGMELTAGKTGWEKISRYHGAVCGGVTADETLGGRSPSCAVDAASLGAWAEAFAAHDHQETWAYEALETLLVNGLPAALTGDKLIPFQRVNCLAANCGTKDCYHVHEEAQQVWRSLSRLCRGWAKAVSSAVTVGEKGLSVNLYIPGRYAVAMPEGTCIVTIADGVVKINAKKEITAALRLRIPAWTEDACITVNDEGGREGIKSTWLTIDRTWQDGDTVKVEFAKLVAVTAGHHQSACVRYGAQVMAYVPQNDVWAVALCGEPALENGQVVASFQQVPEWRKRGSIPADLPVLPKAEGEIIRAVLVPYAETTSRIALFPKGDEA